MTIPKDKSMFSEKNFTKKSVAQKQFAQELTSRLEKLSVKEHEFDESNECSETSSSSVLSSPVKDFASHADRSSFKDNNNGNKEIISSSNLETSKQIELPSKDKKPYQRNQAKANHLNRSNSLRK
ncbi:hypothetical protein MN116_002770 [Schistosoma mekongi]|uniref:Uncharacterized protein n=1 Tax=Schistosoma mekongi TaxID=38744 RepID=A0AAE2D6Q3_SCHME|nr:hypothetical protein MN116_002770 [Schistosoma mekongi]